ncbi:MAG TPA: Crp/Fnr family transcriptional regulator [Crocinitomix sp.]|nr:Crp/Fnr family transcriptional regulator [Crocinitomix sp.]
MILRKALQENFPIISEPELIEEIMKVAYIHEMDEDDILIDINENIKNLPLLVEGSVKILREDENGNEVFLYYVDAGNTCAATLTCCMDSKRSNIRAIVEEKAVFLTIPYQYMDIWMGKYKSWREFILTTYSLRFEELLKAVDQLAFKKMDQRILNFLNEKSNLLNSKIIKISHQQIAYDLNTSREVVSRILKQMERENLVKINRGQLELLE